MSSVTAAPSRRLLARNFGSEFAGTPWRVRLVARLVSAVMTGVAQFAGLWPEPPNPIVVVVPPAYDDRRNHSPLAAWYTARSVIPSPS
jgi:hypothetical protein